MKTPVTNRNLNAASRYDALYGTDGWHYADECDDLDCKKQHLHDSNCRCPDCCAEFDS